MEKLSDLTGGYDFADVVAKYWQGHDTGNEQLKADAVRWLRGEYSTRTDARAALGVRTIIDDANFYDQLKLFARFVRLAGFDGLLVCLDEMVNLYKLANTQARNSNYEQILRILNDSLQGSAAGIGFLFGGTPDFLTDSRRGLYSYAALQSRLAENTFAVGGRVDMSGPVIRLSSLTPEDLYVLLRKLVHVYAAGDPDAYLVPDEALHAFMKHCSNRIGDAYFRTPRNTIRAFSTCSPCSTRTPGSPGRTSSRRSRWPRDQPGPRTTRGPTRTRPHAGPGRDRPPVHGGGHRPAAWSARRTADHGDDDDLTTFRLDQPRPACAAAAGC